MDYMFDHAMQYCKPHDWNTNSSTLSSKGENQTFMAGDLRLSCSHVK